MRENKIFFFLRTQNDDLSSLLIYLQLKGHNKTLEWLKAHTLYVRFVKLKLINRNVFSESANHNKVQLQEIFHLYCWKQTPFSVSGILLRRLF